MKGRTIWVLVLALLAGGGVFGWQAYQARLNSLPPGFAAGNGRVESVQVDVTTKEPGRVETILVHEGDMVKAGQVVAKDGYRHTRGGAGASPGDRRRGGGQGLGSRSRHHPG